MLENTPVNDIKDKKKRIIFFTIIGIICALAIIIPMVIQIIELANPQPIVEEKPKSEIKEFSSIFDNKLNTQEYEINQISKLDEDKEIIYTAYEYAEKSEGKYDIEIKLPNINIDNDISKNINKEISDIFKAKAQSIMESDAENNVIYTVEYSAYMNSDILSLVIKSNLKEGKNAQRVIVKAYNYNVTSGELIGIDEILSIKQLEKENVKKEIDRVVKENAKQNESLASLGYMVYERDLSNEMYNIENVKNFFYGPNGVLYIIFAYGNNNFTAELDVIPIQ